MNSVCLTGRIATDLVMQESANQTRYVRFNLAVSEYSGGKENTNFIPCTVFGVQAENLVKFMRKGSQIGISGSLNVYSNRLETGEYRTSFGVTTNRVEFLESKGTTQNRTNFEPPFNQENSSPTIDSGLGFEEAAKVEPTTDYLDDSILWD